MSVGTYAMCIESLWSHREHRIPWSRIYRNCPYGSSGEAASTCESCNTTLAPFSFFQGKVSAYRPHWPGTWGAPPARASQLMGSQVHSITQLARVSTWRLEDDISYRIWRLSTLYTESLSRLSPKLKAGSAEPLSLPPKRLGRWARMPDGHLRGYSNRALAPMLTHRHLTYWNIFAACFFKKCIYFLKIGQFRESS